MNFKEWKKGSIKGSLSLGLKPKGIIYLILRYYVFNNFRDITLKYPRFFLLNINLKYLKNKIYLFINKK